MRKTLLLFCFLVMTLIAKAVDFKYDGVTYTILSKSDKTVSTKAGTSFTPGHSGLTGEFKLHEEVPYNGDTYTLTEIGDYSFMNCSELTGTLTIPESVTTIGSNAFQYCSGFSGSLTIPNSVITIGTSAFRGCNGFTGTLTIGNSVTTIGYWAFYDCRGFTGSLIIPDSVTTIGDYAFQYCRGFTGTLTIGNSVATIGTSAFSDCSGFTGTLTIGNSVATIGSSAFFGCRGFNGSLKIPNTVTEIGRYAFYQCTGLEGTLIIPANVERICAGAFQNCSGINALVLNNVLTIGYYDSGKNCANTFTGCPITDIYCFAQTPPRLWSETNNSYGYFTSTTTITAYNFKNYKNINVYVPLDYYPNYIKNESSGGNMAYLCLQGWSEFNLIPITSTETTSITLNKNSLTMEVGDEETLTATVEPFYTEDALTWSVWPEDVVSVEDGKVVALKPGYAVITVKSGNVSATCNVEVKDDTQGGGSEDPNSGTRILFMEPGQQLDIRSYFDYTKEVQPLAVLMDYYEFESSDPEVVDGVSQDGGFEAKKYGMANLKVSYINKIDNTKTVNDFLVFVCPTVTVEHGNGILYSHHVLYNSTPRLSLNPGLGYKLVGVTHDGKEITETLAGNDGMYTPTEPITDNSTINLSLEETGNGPTTDATSIWSNSDIRIYVDGHHVKIAGVAPGTYITMTNLAGKQLYNDNKYHEIDVVDAGVYLITIVGQPNTYKIVVR